jgi:hypothetical protein
MNTFQCDTLSFLPKHAHNTYFTKSIQALCIGILKYKGLGFGSLHTYLLYRNLYAHKYVRDKSPLSI